MHLVLKKVDQRNENDLKLIESMLRCKFSLHIPCDAGQTQIDVLLTGSAAADFPLQFLKLLNKLDYNIFAPTIESKAANGKPANVESSVFMRYLMSEKFSDKILSLIF